MSTHAATSSASASAALFDADDRREGELAAVRILSDALAHRGLIPLGVEQVVGDLEGEPEPAAIGGEHRELFVGGAGRETAEFESGEKGGRIHCHFKEREPANRKTARKSTSLRK
jgi:hypothetical protein